MPALLTWLLLSASPRVEATVRSPDDGVTHVLRGVPLAELMVEGHGDAVLVRCLDGFVVLVGLDLVRRLQPVVADEELLAGGWQPIAAPRGPRYLVWPRGGDGVTSEEWAWGISEIALVDRARYLLPLVPPGGQPAALRGRSLWTERCLHCHAVAGTGGLVGWDLAYPSPLWSYLDDKRLAAYLRDPRSQNPAAHMPAQPLTPAQLHDLLAFLHALIPIPAAH